jgi:hypothetical protein
MRRALFWRWHCALVLWRWQRFALEQRWDATHVRLVMEQPYGHPRCVDVLRKDMRTWVLVPLDTHVGVLVDQLEDSLLAPRVVRRWGKGGSIRTWLRSDAYLDAARRALCRYYNERAPDKRVLDMLSLPPGGRGMQHWMQPLNRTWLCIGTSTPFTTALRTCIRLCGGNAREHQLVDVDGDEVIARLRKGARGGWYMTTMSFRGATDRVHVHIESQVTAAQWLCKQEAAVVEVCSGSVCVLAGGRVCYDGINAPHAVDPFSFLTQPLVALSLTRDD